MARVDRKAVDQLEHSSDKLKAPEKSAKADRHVSTSEKTTKKFVTAATSKTKALSGPVRQKGVVTIPQQIRQALNLEEGDQVIFSVRDGSIVITPAAVVPRDQAWFWSPEWQAMEAEADAEIAAGGGEIFETGEDFIAGFKAA